MGCNISQDDDFVSFRDTGGDVHVLIVSLDYKYCPGKELSCSNDAKAMLRMLRRADIPDDHVTVVTDRRMGRPGFPTRRCVLENIRKVANRCSEGDWFIWFFAGHGVNVKDTNGDEADGFDEAFVTPSNRGKLSEKACLIDDEFAIALDTYFEDGVRLLCICDCCHSGTICDIDSHRYRHEIFQISASADHQEAVDTGRGGVLTNSLRRTILELSVKYRDEEFSIQEVMDTCKKHATKMTRAQDLSCQYSGLDPALVAWPLSFPWWKYGKSAHRDLRDFEESE